MRTVRARDVHGRYPTAGGPMQSKRPGEVHPTRAASPRWTSPAFSTGEPGRTRPAIPESTTPQSRHGSRASPTTRAAILERLHVDQDPGDGRDRRADGPFDLAAEDVGVAERER